MSTTTPTTMRAEITDLPEEVLRIIFQELDGRSLFRLARVCKFWHRIVHELRRNVKMWSTFCLTEIPMPLLAEMTGMVDVSNLLLPPHGVSSSTKQDHHRTIPVNEDRARRRSTSCIKDSPEREEKDNLTCSSVLDQKKTSSIIPSCVVSSRLPWQFWREVYLAYRRTRLISTWPCLRRSIPQIKNYGKTTCVKFHGNLLLTGHENGAVLCWQNAGTVTQVYTVLHRHRSTVTALAVVDYSNLTHGKCPVFTVMSGSDDRDLRMTAYDSKPLESVCYNICEAITSISSWGQYFVTGGQETFLGAQVVFRLSSKLTREICYRLLAHCGSNVRSTAIWGNKVVSGDDAGNVYVWELMPNHHNLQPLVTHTLPGPIQQTLICGDRILCLANKDVLAVSLDCKQFCKFSVYDSLFRTPECLTAWGPILAIGLKSGIIVVYHLDSDAEWQNINLSKPVQTLHTGEEHVLDLSITDSGLGLSIAFSTDDNSIHLAHWVPRLPQNTI